jgi:hypothetical protein
MICEESAQSTFTWDCVEASHTLIGKVGKTFKLGQN